MISTEIYTMFWGNIPYQEAWKLQQKYFESLVEAHFNHEPHHNYIIFCEHPPVYTLGRHGKATNMLLDEAHLKSKGAELIQTDRGGDITFHGPGQVVCYPIINLENFGMGLKAYINTLEEAVIQVCAHYGITGGRVNGATGVWLGIGTPEERKICAIGVKSSHFITMHGLALNVNTNLQYFSYIHPCGFINKGVTSIAQELGHEVPTEDVCKLLDETLKTLLLKQAEIQHSKKA